MLYIMNSEGAIKSVPSRVNQGSVNVNEIILLAPFPSDTTATLAIELPNKIKIVPRLMTNVDFATNFIKDADGRYYNAWRYVLPGALTEYAGTARLTFYLNTSDGVLPSDECTMTINKTTPYLHETANESDYTIIGAYLSAAKENANDALLAKIQAQFCATYAENAIYGANAGQPVDSTSPYYQNNAKYYAEDTRNSANEAIDACDEAVVAADEAKNSADRSEEFASDAREYAEALKVDRVTDITLQYDNKNHIIKVGLKGILADGTEGTIGTLKEFDLPLESVVVGGAYNDKSKRVILTLEGGSTVEFSVADLVSGLVSQTDFDKKVEEFNKNIASKANASEVTPHPDSLSLFQDNYAEEDDIDTYIPVYQEWDGEYYKMPVNTDCTPNSVVRRTDRGTVITDKPTNNWDAANKKYVDGLTAPIAEHAESIANHESRIEAIEDTLVTTEEDKSTAYEKTVPTGVRPYATIDFVGGMSYKSKNLYNPYVPNWDGKTFTVDRYGGIVINSDSVADDGYVYLPNMNFAEEGTHYIYFTADFEIPGMYTITSSNMDSAQFAGSSGSSSITSDFSEWGADDLAFVIEGIAPDDFEEGSVCIMVSTEPITEFEPYFEGIRDTKTTDIVSKGAQLIPFPYKDGGAGVSVKRAGVTWTVNADGSITANGTATGVSTFKLSDATSFTLPKSRYILSGCPVGGGTSTYYLLASANNNGTYVNETMDIGAGRVYNLTNSTYTGIHIDLAVKAGTVCDNLTFYPMLNYCPSGSTPAPYKPYKSEPVDIFTIPKAIQELEGYGKNGFVLDFDTKTATYNGNTTDLSAYLTYDEYKTITVEAGGKVVFENEHKYAVPSSITYTKE